MSSLSPPFKAKFNNPQGLNKFWLITLCEYLESETSKGGNARTVKWTLPLIWANTMVCEASVRPHDVNRLKDTDLWDIINEIKNVTAVLIKCSISMVPKFQI